MDFGHEVERLSSENGNNCSSSSRSRNINNPSSSTAALTSSSSSPSSSSSSPSAAPSSSRYENQKKRDWNAFGQYLKNHKPPLTLPRCSGAHVLEFLRYLDQFGKTKVHTPICPFYGHPNPPMPCHCPLQQAWGSLDSLIGRLRAAFEENGGKPEANPFGTRAVTLYLREVRQMQSKARGVSYEKKKKRKQPPQSPVLPPPPPPPPPPPAGSKHCCSKQGNSVHAPEAIWRQKSKVKREEEGDENSKFIHRYEF